MGNETADFLAQKSSRISCQPSLPRALHATIHNTKSKMDQEYLDNVNSINTNKKWVDIDTGSRNLYKLDCKETAAKFNDKKHFKMKGRERHLPDSCL
jgi:hypothetical protein